MKRWTSFDTRWMVSLFGTAVGAGILFLPIRAGTGGFLPVVIMTILIFPMVWLSHRALSRFVLESQNDGHDITQVAEEYWGRGASLVITILYFFAIYPICLAYGVGITNTFESFFINQLGLNHFVLIAADGSKSLEPVARAVLAFILVLALMSIMFLKEEWITWACTILVYPLCGVLLAFSLYLIPQWNLQAMTAMPEPDAMLVLIWLTLPVLVFSFNHSPAISTFSLSVKREYNRDATHKSNAILFWTATMLLVFVMFFVFSCILSLSPTDFDEARRANIPILSYFANKLDNPIISYGAPLVAFLAIASSFFGHYFGAYEGLNGIIRKSVKSMGGTPNIQKIRSFSTIFMFVTIVLAAYWNPSVLDFIESLGGPVIAMILFIMPIIAIWTVAKLKHYRNSSLDAFVLITGMLTITSVVYKLL